jgi:hypothetical protein
MLVFSLNFEVGIWLALLTVSDLNRALNNVCERLRACVKERKTGLVLVFASLECDEI